MPAMCPEPASTNLTRPPKQREPTKTERGGAIWSSRAATLYGNVHLRKVHLNASDLHASLGEVVPQITVAQVKAMIRRGHPRRVRVPKKQVERHRLFAFHVHADDVRPDQIIGSKQVKNSRHFATVEIAKLSHFPLYGLDLVLIAEDLQVAGVSEIHLRC